MYQPLPSEMSKRAQPGHLLIDGFNIIVGIVALAVALYSDQSDEKSWTTLVLITLLTVGTQFAVSLVVFVMTFSPAGCFKQKAVADWRIYQFFIFANNISCTTGLALWPRIHVYAILGLCLLRIVSYMPLIMLNEDMFSTLIKKDASGETLEDAASLRRQFLLYVVASVIDFVCLLVMVQLSSIMEMRLLSTLAVLFFTSLGRALHAYYLYRRPDAATLSPLLVFSTEAFVANAGIWAAIFLWPVQL